MEKKWLLDHNLPKQIAKFLKSVGVDCNWTSAEGWQHLSNGDLVRNAMTAGYSCLLTNDRKFANSAGNALAKNPNFAVIEINLEQAPKKEFLSNFQFAWQDEPIKPIPAKVTKWPK